MVLNIEDKITSQIFPEPDWNYDVKDGGRWEIKEDGEVIATSTDGKVWDYKKLPKCMEGNARYEKAFKKLKQIKNNI